MNNKGFIVLRHSVLETISEEQAEKALEADFEQEGVKIRFKHVAIEPIENIPLPHKEIKDIQWGAVAHRQEAIYEEQIRPLLNKFPEFEVVYFGTAPIPLAMHMGSLMGTWKKVLVYLKHHQGEKQWYRMLADSSEISPLQTKGIPNEKYNVTSDVLIRVAASYEIDADETVKSIGTEIAKEIDVFLDPLQYDLDGAEQVVEIADKFGEALRAVANHLKQADTVHVIATVPVGLAFLMGAQISANVSHPVQTYQYYSSAEVKYDPVLKINSGNDDFGALTNEQAEAVLRLKSNFSKAVWPFMQASIENERQLLQKAKVRFWVDHIFDKGTHTKPFDSERWRSLPFISETPLENSGFNAELDPTGGFQFYEKENVWGIGNMLLHGLMQKLDGDNNRVFRGMRMLLFHEGMHYWRHGLNDATAESIGMFPKILEEADYQADVWAMLYEYNFSKSYHRSDIITGNESAFFAGLIEIALSTMWSFDDAGVDLRQIQIRRMNRYLNWYWQLLRLEDRRNSSVNEAIKILAAPPLIELKGLIPKTENRRIFHRLDRFETDDLEIGVFWENRIIRTGNLGFFRIEDLVNGFKKRDNEQIKRVLNGLYKNVSTQL